MRTTSHRDQGAHPGCAVPGAEALEPRTLFAATTNDPSYPSQYALAAVAQCFAIERLG